MSLWDLCIHVGISLSPNTRSFSGPGGVLRGLDFGGQAKIRAQELASVASSGLQGPPSTNTTHHPLPPPTTNDKYD